MTTTTGYRARPASECVPQEKSPLVERVGSEASRSLPVTWLRLELCVNSPVHLHGRHKDS